MKYDIILGGVGGQGVLSLAAVIATAAQQAGLQVRQSEVHGMAQRGGAVQAHLRMADGAIAGDLVGTGMGDMIISMEPVEALRYLSFLAPGGKVIASEDPILNIGDYPELEGIHAAIRAIPGSRLVAANKLAKDAGNPKASNMVMVGAAMEYLPFARSFLEDAVKSLFGRKGESVVEGNLKAMLLGAGA